MSTKTVNVIGRSCLVRDKKVDGRHFFGATVIDARANEPDRAQRIRLQTGEHAGEVRGPGEYDVLEWTD